MKSPLAWRLLIVLQLTIRVLHALHLPRPDLSTLINEKVHSLDEDVDLFHGSTALLSGRNSSTDDEHDERVIFSSIAQDKFDVQQSMEAPLLPSNNVDSLSTANRPLNLSIIKRKTPNNSSIGSGLSRRQNGKRPVFTIEQEQQKHEDEQLTSQESGSDPLPDLSLLPSPTKIVSSSTLEVHSPPMQINPNPHSNHTIESTFESFEAPSLASAAIPNVSFVNATLSSTGPSFDLSSPADDLNVDNAISSTLSPNVNYNQQDPLNPLQIIAHPIQNLVLRSFEGYRRLLKNSQAIENYIINRLKLPKWTKIRRLDPLDLPEPLFFEHRDQKAPMIGKLKFTFEGVQISGLSNFKVESLSNQGRTLHFKHRIPQLDSVANYTVDYHLFDEIPLRISEGQLKASVPNAYIKGSFQVLPDILNVWFKVANLNLTGWIDDVDMHVFPNYVISDRFKIERSTINKMNAAVRAMMPDILEYLKVTYNKAIELKMV
jgi:hypothetical protein